ncbi:hypothetical protein BDA99DRAFT_556487 [Phascolomyces articulosus]|uniref:Major facilitator superfamily associated domain-containing protein n=1 Tax=Phascolomyces articulosus TaxID=60185 RepID=A0AAD5KJL8_9FUNG|nr:hypothetical protein BDA99DRAFT_556487 [Phascolomyces articulosus]
MIYWSRLLAIAHAVSCSTELYLPLFLWNDRDLDPFLIGMLTAIVLILRLMASCICIWWVDRSGPATHIQLLLALSLIGSLALLGVFMSPDNLISLVLFMVANGLFYQPLAALIDSAIIKTLGDYKSWLYGNERQWANGVLALTLLFIGCINDVWSNQYLGYVLASIVLVGCISLLCITLILIYRHNGLMLLDYMMIADDYDDVTNGGSDVYFEETMTAAPRFLKNAMFFQPPQHYYNDSLMHPYKPYSLFGEPLSHISEEDASMLRRMASSNSNQLMRHNSNQSINSTTTTTSTAALAASGSVPIAVYGSTNTATTTQHPLDFFSSAWRRYNSISQQQQQQQPQTQQQHGNLPPNVNVNSAAVTTTHSHHSQQQSYYYQQQQQLQQQQQQLQLASSMDLSLLPLPPNNTPMSVLLLLHVDGGGTVVDQLIQWQIQSMSLTTLMLGVIYGMMNTLLFIYLYQVLDLSMWMIGLAAMVPVLSDFLVHSSARWWIPRFTITVTTTMVHAALIICSFVYSWLRPEWPMLWLQIIFLQVLQGIAFPLVWLVMTQRICALLWTDEDQRIAQVGKLSALFSSVGPAVGALLAGFLLSGNDTDIGSSTDDNTEAMDAFLMAGYTLVFRCNIALTAASFVVSWGWSSTD